MTHLLLLVIHAVALVAMPAALFVTLPLHAVVVVLQKNRRQADPSIDMPSPHTHVRCPDCRELVLRDARKCKHCGTALVPQ